jgi:hypothetical protein
VISATHAGRAALVVGVCVLAGGAFALNHALVGVVYDDGLYAGIAVALSHGLGFVHPHLPGTPAVIHYPPLYPLVLAPLYGTLSVDAAGYGAKILNLGFAALAAVLITWYVVRTNLLGDGTPRWLGPVIVGASALAIPCLSVQSVLFAEPLYSVLLAAAVLLADAPPSRWRPEVGALLSGLAAALAMLTRTIGVTAGAGIALVFLLRRVPHSRIALTALPTAVAAAAWWAWTVAHRAGIDPAMAINYGSYGEVVRQTGLVGFWQSAPDLVRPLGTITLAWLPSRALYYVFGVPALLVLLYGLGVALRRSAVGFTLVGYAAILAVWPFSPDRFIWAVLPWLALLWALGAIELHRRQPRSRLPLIVLAATMIVGYGLMEVSGALHQGWRLNYAGTSANYTELLPQIQTLPAGAVLATDDEPLVWLYDRVTAVPFYVYGYAGSKLVSPTPQVHRAYLERMGVTHILFAGFGSGSDAELNALLGAYPGWLTVVHAWPDGRALFRVTVSAGRPVTR